MPLPKKVDKSNEKEVFRELGSGKTYKHTSEKFGKKRADKQRVAIVLKAEGKSVKKKSR